MTMSAPVAMALGTRATSGPGTKSSERRSLIGETVAVAYIDCPATQPVVPRIRSSLLRRLAIVVNLHRTAHDRPSNTLYYSSEVEVKPQHRRMRRSAGTVGLTLPEEARTALFIGEQLFYASRVSVRARLYKRYCGSRWPLLEKTGVPSLVVIELSGKCCRDIRGQVL